MGPSGTKKGKWVEGNNQLAPRMYAVSEPLGSLSESTLKLAEFSGPLGAQSLQKAPKNVIYSGQQHYHISSNSLFWKLNTYQAYKSISAALTIAMGACYPVAKLCPTPFDPMDCSMPGSFAHGISQAGILEWVAIFFSKGSFWSRDRTRISCIGRQILYHRATREVPAMGTQVLLLSLFYRWGKWPSERLGNLPTVSQPAMDNKTAKRGLPAV